MCLGAVHLCVLVGNGDGVGVPLRYVLFDLHIKWIDAVQLRYIDRLVALFLLLAVALLVFVFLFLISLLLFLFFYILFFIVLQGFHYHIFAFFIPQRTRSGPETLRQILLIFYARTIRRSAGKTGVWMQMNDVFVHIIM